MIRLIAKCSLTLPAGRQFCKGEYAPDGSIIFRANVIQVSQGQSFLVSQEEANALLFSDSATISMEKTP